MGGAPGQGRGVAAAVTGGVRGHGLSRPPRRLDDETWHSNTTFLLFHSPYMLLLMSHVFLLLFCFVFCRPRLLFAAVHIIFGHSCFTYIILILLIFDFVYCGCPFLVSFVCQNEFHLLLRKKCWQIM